MKGIFSFRLVALLLVLLTVYFFICDFKLPTRDTNFNAESIAYVDSVKQLDLFDFYSYDQIYYHYSFEDMRFCDSVTESRYTGTVNRGDSLLVVISRVDPARHSVKSIYGRSQEPLQVMSR